MYKILLVKTDHNTKWRATWKVKWNSGICVIDNSDVVYYLQNTNNACKYCTFSEPSISIFFISAPEPTSWPTFYYYLVQKLDSNISTGTTVQIYRNYFICFIIPVINNPKALVRIKSPAFCFLCDITEIGFMSKTGCTGSSADLVK